MNQKIIRPDEIQREVRERYGSLARQSTATNVGCCGPQSDCCGGGGAAAGVSQLKAIYDAPDVGELPPEVTNISLGCGDPITLAELQPGQTVLDLGSGGGIDCFLAAKRVGPGGSVIGVDMTADMIDLARANAGKLGVPNVEFRLGEIEHLPVGDNAVDVIISNCVINLSTDKARVFREAFRVLRPGGKLAVSDIVTRMELPPSMRRDLDAWASCVAGAWVDKDYVGAIEAAGFVDVSIEEKTFDDSMIEAIVVSLDSQGTSIDPHAAHQLGYSARVTARKPVQS